MYGKEIILIPFEKEYTFLSHQKSSKIFDDQIPSIFHFLKLKLTFKKQVAQLYA